MLMTAKDVDVLLVGGGVMSATLGMLLKQLDPHMAITLVERLDHVAHESTDGWNNAGTGHAGYCELNYTPEADDGSITINRALSINANFEVTLQFWSHLVEQKILPAPTKFINPTAHQSFVWGERMSPSCASGMSCSAPTTCSRICSTASPPSRSPNGCRWSCSSADSTSPSPPPAWSTAPTSTSAP